MSPLFPLGFLALGVLGLGLGLLPRFRYVAVIPIGATLGALFTWLIVAFRLPANAMLSNWPTTQLFTIALRLEVDGLTWLYGVGILAITLGTLLTGLARTGGRRVGTRGVVLLMALTGLLAVSAENLVTRILAWMALDIVYIVALLIWAEGDGLEPQAVLNLSFNTVGTLLTMGAALLISRASDTLSLRETTLSSQATLLVTLAAVFRLGLFPLHLGLPTEINLRPGLGTMLRLLPAAAALEMLSRLAAFGFDPTLRPWLTVFGLAAVLVGATQLWGGSDPRRGMAYVIIAQSGVALLAGLWAGANGAQALTAQGLALVLGGALVFLSHGHDERLPWLSAIPVLGAVVMMGAPFTVGFLGIGTLYNGLLSAGGWAWVIFLLLFVMQGLLFGGLLYTCFAPGFPLKDDPMLVAAHWAGLGFITLLSVVMAVFSGLLSVSVGQLPAGLMGFSNIGSVWAVLSVIGTLGLGLGLWRFENYARAQTERLAWTLAILHRLDWLYRLIWGLINGLSLITQNIAAVLEGEGAVLWALVAVLLLGLLFRAG
jgi:formate hydrogenlyase subunit 3/multisubunit Na+/H+ antiporter MnhD subunit